MQATCKSDQINVFSLDKLWLKKEVVALVVVCSDIGIGFLLYFLFVYLKGMQYITMHEIDEADISAKDFTVEVKNLPEHTSIRLLKTQMWTFIEQMSQQEQKELTDKVTGCIDDNQNNVMNVNFGLSDYGRMRYMLKMADLLTLQKKEEIRMTKEPHNSELCKKKIQEIQTRTKEQLSLMEEYSKKIKSKGIVAFAQFQSMNGKEKFLKSLRVNACLRCCNRKKYQHR